MPVGSPQFRDVFITIGLVVWIFATLVLAIVLPMILCRSTGSGSASIRAGLAIGLALFASVAIAGVRLIMQSVAGPAHAAWAELVYAWVGASTMLIASVSAVLLLVAVIRRHEGASFKSPMEDALDSLQVKMRELDEGNRRLEERSAHLTLRDRRLTHAMAAAGAVAVQWEVGSGKVLWHIGGQRELNLFLPAVGTWTNRAIFPDSQFAHRMTRISDEYPDFAEVQALVVDRQGSRHWIRMKATRDPRVNGQPDTWTALMRLLDEKPSGGVKAPSGTPA